MFTSKIRRWTPILLSCCSAFTMGEDAGWRGNGTCYFTEVQPPVTWSSQSDNIVWKSEVGSGYCSPVSCNGCVYLTAEPSDVVAIDAATGKEKWRTQIGYAEVLGADQAERITRQHRELDDERRKINREYNELRKQNPEAPELEQLKAQQQEANDRRKEFEKQYPSEKRGGAGNAAATTYFADGKLFVIFGTGIVAALNESGAIIWSRHLEVPQQGFGHSASPIMAGGYLIVHIQHLTALNPDTGKSVWQATVPAKFGTPAVTTLGGEDVIVTPAGSFVRARDGLLLAEKQFQLSNNSPLIHDGVVYAHAGGKIRAIKLPNTAQTPFEPEELWQVSGSRDQRMASAVLHNGLLYAAGRKGIMDVTDAKTGDAVYRERTDIGEIFGSPAIAGDKIFLGGKDGKMVVVETGSEYREVSRNETERLTTSPIFDGNRMYLRADKFLYCIESQGR